ncbi:secreted phosphoprotein 24-like [Latimeria chalumnae]|uniref:Secreted phosphoprotein 24 n=1 Tax=Latimeria chalumnae TaxID=7897 RepID=M3XKL1_LATCH|nr:PREDICTED: secreted phosphoprotein 24-like isoform X1 [Latimeria chalumnae]|eukprot:XP_014345847.1 PREDICTED: secreted phosphoprotein 24-like isoform X1 [Latimeria chalumnae]
MNSVIFILLGIQVLYGSGLPTYDDYNRQPQAEAALNASLAKLNSFLRGPNLYGVTRSFLKASIPLGRDSYLLVIQFDVCETSCRKNSGKHPDECDFKFGRYARSSRCTSIVHISGQEINRVTVDCSFSGDSSSESMSSSSEEMVSMGRGRSNRRPGMQHSLGNGMSPALRPNHQPNISDSQKWE